MISKDLVGLASTALNRVFRPLPTRKSSMGKYLNSLIILLGRFQSKTTTLEVSIWSTGRHDSTIKANTFWTHWRKAQLLLLLRKGLSKHSLLETAECSPTRMFLLSESGGELKIVGTAIATTMALHFGALPVKAAGNGTTSDRHYQVLVLKIKWKEPGLECGSSFRVN